MYVWNARSMVIGFGFLKVLFDSAWPVSLVMTGI